MFSTLFSLVFDLPREDRGQGVLNIVEINTGTIGIANWKITARNRKSRWATLIEKNAKALNGR